MRSDAPIRLFGFVLLLLSTPLFAADNWPEYRGPTQQGQAVASKPPVKWSEKQNIKWKTAIPGQGWSSPVIWGEQVWMTTALDKGRSLRAICVDKSTGRIVYNIEVFTPAKPQSIASTNSWASPSPVIEEGRVYVCFGTDGNACIDTSTGRIIWKNSDFKIEHQVGAGASPILYKDLYILNCDGTDFQYIVGLNKLTGKLVWKSKRSFDFDAANVVDHLRKAFTVPIIANVDGRDVLLSVGARRVGGYDPLTGRELWYCDVPGFSTVPRPVVYKGLLLVCTGYMKPEVYAVRLAGASGDISQSHLVWKFNQGVPAQPSLLVADGELFLCADNGIIRSIDAATGRLNWQKRLGSTYVASPLYAGGHVYLFTESGETIVLKPGGKEANVVAENTLDAGFMASPAVSGNALFLRTKTHLYRVEE